MAFVSGTIWGEEFRSPRLCRRQLVRQLRPFGFHNRSHLIGDDGDLLDLQHVLVQSQQIRRRHSLATDDARRTGAPAAATADWDAAFTVEGFKLQAFVAEA
jgi:hypothetical protein